MDCEFKNKDGLLDPYTGVTLLTDRSYAGIWMNDVKFVNIGTGAGDASSVNLFEDLIYGLHLRNTNARVTNCKFVDVHHHGDQQFLHTTAGVTSVASSGIQINLDFEGLGKGSSNITFYRCRRAFIIQRVNAKISESRGETVLIAVDLKWNAGRRFQFSDNDFTCRSGIISSNHSFQIPISHFWTVADNQFTIGGTTYVPLGYISNEAGILFVNSHVMGSKGSLGVHDNEFDLIAPISALKGMAVGGLQFEHNIIRIDLSRHSKLIAVDWLATNQGSMTPNLFFHNTITDNSISGDKEHIGFRTVISRSNNFYCNYTHNVDVGFRFFGNCNYTNFEMNGIFASDIGLELKAASVNSANIGPQPNTMNLWGASTSYATAGAQHHSQEPLITEMSKFDLHTMDLPYWPDPLIDPSDNWFEVDGEEGEDCQVTIPDPWKWNSRDNLVWSDYRVVMDSSGILSSKDQWLLRYDLYQKLHADSVLRVSDQDVLDWYEHQDQSNLAALTELLLVIGQDLSGVTAAIAQNVQDRTHHLAEVLERVAEIDTTLLAGPIAGMEEELDSLYLVLADIRIADSLDWVQIRTNQQSALAHALTMHDNFIPAHDYEVYLHDVYGVLLEMLDNNWSEPDSLGKSLIGSIAELCVGEGGHATVIARSLELTYADNVYDDDILCDPPPAPFKYIPDPAGIAYNIDISLFPNPTTDVVILQGEAGDGEWILTDITGRPVFQQKVDLRGGVAQVSGLSRLPAGVYMWYFLSNDKMTRANGLLVRK